MNQHLEILARGPSRHPPTPGLDHWWLSVAYPKDRHLEPTDWIFSLHGDDLLEPWLPNSSQTVTLGQSDKLPKAEFIEREMLLAWYGPVFACSVAWMLAKAISAGYASILLNGVDHLRPEERRERESITYWCGRADSLGTKIRTVPGSGIKINYGAYPR